MWGANPGQHLAAQARFDQLGRSGKATGAAGTLASSVRIRPRLGVPIWLRLVNWGNAAQ